MKKMKMKHTMKILYVLVLICSNTYGQKTKGFELKGNIDGLKNRSMIYLVTQSGDTLLKSVSNGSDFSFKGYVDGEANFYFIQVDTNINKINPSKNPYSNALWLINDKMTVNGNLKNWDDLILSGSDAQQDWEEFKTLQEKYWDKPEWLSLIDKFIETHKNSLFTPYINIRDGEKTYSLLTQRAKNSYWGRQLKNRINQSKIIVSSEIPFFNITTPEGKSISIHEITSNNTYTLIDFWASWCAPCRDAIPKMKKTYEAFRAKGFNIIGVSTDKKEADWKKALAQENMPWQQGLDNIDVASSKIFGLSAIPGYILVDRKGKIVRMDVISNSGSQFTIVKADDKKLGSDLYEIVEQLLKEKTGN